MMHSKATGDRKNRATKSVIIWIGFGSNSLGFQHINKVKVNVTHSYGSIVC